MSKIHSTAVIESSAKIGSDVTIGPNCFIDVDAEIGDGCILDANVIIGKGVKAGKMNVFYPNCVIGKNPQMLNARPEMKFGGLEIGNDNMIREFVTIHPSIYRDSSTKVGNNNLIMVSAHIGHDCIVEDKVVLSNNTQISGHCKIETGAWLSGTVQIHQFTTVGKWSYAAAFSGLNHDVPPFLIVSGHYPPRVRGVNERGLNRAGLNEQQQAAVMKAYRMLFRTKKPLLQNVQALIETPGIDENVRAMCQSILNSNKQRFGRFLEASRRKE